MTNVIELVERRRNSLGQTQAAVAAACAITQPHYSKVVGGLASLTPNLEDRLKQWLEGNPAGQGAGELNSEILALTRQIASSSRRLNALLTRAGKATQRRRPRISSNRGRGSGG